MGNSRACRRRRNARNCLRMATRAALPQDVAVPSGFRVHSDARPDRQPVPRPPGRTASTRRCRARSRRVRRQWSSTRAARGTRSRTTVPYPFVVNPHFKHWLPITDAPDCFVAYAPGHRPRLCFHQPADYWHRPPALPGGDWQREFDISIVREPGAAREVLSPDLRSSGLHRRVAAGVRAVGFRRRQSRARARASAFPARSEDTVRDRVHAPRVGRRGARTRRCAGRVPGRRVRVRGSPRLLRSIRPARKRLAVRQHHRVRRGRGGAALPAPRAGPWRAAALLPDRCGRAVPRLCVGHHSHLASRRPGIWGDSWSRWMCCSTHSPTAFVPAATTATCTSRRTGRSVGCSVRPASSAATPTRRSPKA